MKDRLKWYNENGFTFIEVMMAIVVLVAIGVAAYFVYNSHTHNELDGQDKPLSFDTPVSGAIGPACSYMTAIGCFEPTDTRPLGKIREQGYSWAHIEGKGYTEYEELHGSAANAPGVKTKVVRLTRIDSIKGVGPKHD
jgi:prepilin-type N-terminal cleavage/methylation domain-containing protein